MRGLLLLFAVALATVLPPTLAKKKRSSGSSVPDRDEALDSFLGPGFGEILANVSRASVKLQHWDEYDRVADQIRSLLIREGEKGTRVIQFTVVNPDRQFGQGNDMGRYSEVLQYMLKGKGPEGEGQSDDDVAKAVMGCIPLRERYCLEKMARATRLGSFVSVENCHRWNQATLLLGDGLGAEGRDMPDVSVDWRKLCSECFGERVQVAVKAHREGGHECLELSDEESESLVPQFPSNWTIDVSTRTTIGGMRMEERKLLPIGKRWLPLPSLQSAILRDMAASGLHIRGMGEDGQPGLQVTEQTIRETYPGTVFNYAVYLW